MTSPIGPGQHQVITQSQRWTSRRALPLVSPTAKLNEHGVAPVPEDKLLNRDHELPRGERWEKLLALAEQLQNGQAALAERLWAAIPSYITEWGYQASATQLSSTGANSFGTLSAQTTDLELITNIVATVPSGQTGIIQLRDIVIPIGQGLSVINGCAILLSEADLRQLTVTAAGPICLMLSGQVAPSRGKLPL